MLHEMHIEEKQVDGFCKDAPNPLYARMEQLQAELHVEVLFETIYEDSYMRITAISYPDERLLSCVLTLEEE